MATETAVEVIHTNRVFLLKSWRIGEANMEKIGSGKYGTVYSAGDGAYVLKENITRRERSGLCKQAFREHSMGILQTLAVLERCTPHMPLHYGISVALDSDTMRGNMYMERFEGSLLDLGAVCLQDEDCWLCLVFSIMYTCVSLALLFEVSHNDVYPRNILINPNVRSPKVIYRCHDKLYAIGWPFLAVLTDFGVATSTSLMDKINIPEVAQNVPNVPLPRNFGMCVPSNHILKYKELPHFSRDFYTILKWLKFPSSSLPGVPLSLQAWANVSLQLLDNTLHTMHTPRGMVRYFHSIFSDTWLNSCGLRSVETDAVESSTDFVCCPCRGEKDDMLRSAAYILQSLTSSRAFDCKQAASAPLKRNYSEQ